MRAWFTVHTLAVLLSLGVYVAYAVGRRPRRYPSSAIAWVLLLVLLPYLGLPLFLVFGTLKASKSRTAAAVQAGSQGEACTQSDRLESLAIALGAQAAAGYRSLDVHEDGERAARRLRDIVASATRSIDLSTFLVGRDRFGASICDMLAARSREGVQVRVLVDGVGRWLGAGTPLRAMRAAGVQVRLFAPPLPSLGQINLRNHRKLVIADGQALWMGGRNLAAEYFEGRRSSDGLRREQPWTDLTFDLEGPVVAQAAALFERDWTFAGGQRVPEGLALVHERSSGRHPASSAPCAQLLPSGPDEPEDIVYEFLVDAIFGARERVIVCTPYFVPDPTLLMALTLAARRGVRVDLVVPRRSNHVIADLVRPSSLQELLAAGSRVWLSRGMMHAKLVVIDATLALAGSVNLDQRSLFLNYESMLAFYDRAAVERFGAWAQSLFHSSDALAPAAPRPSRDFAEGLLRWLTFQL